MAHASKTAFGQALIDYGLAELEAQFKENGWETFNDFAFATSDPRGQDAAAFQKEVIEVLLPSDGSKKALIPKLRRLFAQAYVFASKAMNDEAEPKPLQELIPMHQAERTACTTKLRDRITGWTLSGQNLPSQTLIDKMSTMLTKGHVKYVPWERCTSKEQELLEEPEVKGLRITPEGLLLQDVARDMTTDLSGEFLWDFALRRRACAGDVSGLISFEAQNEWQEVLKSTYLKQPPPGHKKVSWTQLRNADVMLWQEVAMICEDGTKVNEKSKPQTAFEAAWRLKMKDQTVLACLTFLPGASSASTSSAPVSEKAAPVLTPGPDSEMNKLKRRLEQQQNEIRNLKANKGKGKGNGKGKNKGKNVPRAPADLGRRPARTENGENICFPYNKASGCPLAGDGGKCHKGRHVCLECHGPHSLALPCPRLNR